MKIFGREVGNPFIIGDTDEAQRQYDEDLRNAPDGDWRRQQERVRAQANPVFAALPDWVTTSINDLEKQYLDALKYEYAYQYLIENFTAVHEDEQGSFTFQAMIQSGSMEKAKAEGGQGVINSKEQVEAIMGPYDPDDENARGTNFLSLLTKWKKFGLITGVNMQAHFASPFAADHGSADLSSIDYKYHGDAFKTYRQYNHPTSAGDQEQAEAIEAFKNWRQSEDPRYLTNAKGIPEPGITFEDFDWGTVREEAAARGNRRGHTLTGYVAHSRSPANDQLFLWAEKDEDAHRRGRYFPSTVATSLKAYDPLSTRAGSTMQGYGHFLSPNLWYALWLGYGPYAQNAGSVESMRAALTEARSSLVAKAEPVITTLRNSFPSIAQAEPYEGYGTFGTGQYFTYTGVVDGAWEYSATPFSDDHPKIQTKKGTHAVPDMMIVWPTLPIQGYFRAPKGSDATGFGEYLQQLRNQGFSQDEVDAFADTEEALKPMFPKSVAAAWRDLYKDFRGGFGGIASLATQLESAMFQRAGNGNVEGLFGDGVEGSETWLKDVLSYVESYLDFLGAGRIDAPTEAQARSATAGGEPELGDVKEDIKKNILNYRVLKPFDFQCFLMENIDILSEIQEQFGFYKNVAKVKGPPDMDISPGEIVSTLHMGGKPNVIQMLQNLEPAVYGLLVPSIKLYRVDYDKENPQKVIAQHEIPIPNFIPNDDITQMTAAGGGRYSGWGLKSFSWGLEGVQPETVDNNISATLQFYFQSINDFFQGSMAAGGPVPTPLDLLIAPRTAETVLGHNENNDQVIDEQVSPCKTQGILKDNVNREWDGASFRIKAVAGWALPPNIAELLPGWPLEPAADQEANALYTPNIKDLKVALELTRTSLFLQQTRHDINFNQDGSLELSIQYQAALSGMLTSNRADILGLNSEAHRTELETLEKDIKRARGDVSVAKSAADVEGAGGAEKGELKGAKKKLKELLERQKELLNQDRLKKYSRFLASLYGREIKPDGTLTGGNIPSKVYTVEVHKEELFQQPMHKLDPDDRAAKARQRMSSARGFSITTSPGSPTNTDLLQQVSDTLNSGRDISTQDISKEFASQWKVALGNPENIYIPYFYLGDLIDLVLENNIYFNSSAAGKRKCMTMLAEVDVINPLILYQTDSVEQVLCADRIDDAALTQQLSDKGYSFTQGIKKRINIGSIPISLDAFNVWFKDNVIKQEKNSYYLLHFIKDICAQLIGVSLRNACFGSNIINNIRFDTDMLQFYNPQERYVYPAAKYRGKPRPVRADSLAGAIQTARLGRTDIAPTGMDPEKAATQYDLSQGLLVYSTDAKPAKRSGDPAADASAGILHNYLGSSRGLVKSINFNRVDQEYLREAKIQKFGSLGAQQLRELYSATIEMIGNTLYKNGQYTFIWPSYTSGDKKYARLLGLGGYFLVTGVNHTISSEGYNVTVNALQEGISFSEEVVSVSFDSATVDIPINEAVDTPRTDPVIAIETERTAAARDAQDETAPAPEHVSPQWMQDAQSLTWEENFTTPLTAAELEAAAMYTADIGLDPKKAGEMSGQMFGTEDIMNNPVMFRMATMYLLYSQGRIGESDGQFRYLSDN